MIAFALSFSLFSCGGSPKERIFGSLYFDTVGTFYDYTDSSDEEFGLLADRVEQTIAEYHKLYDIYNEYDGIANVATINKMAGHGEVKVDQRIIDLLVYSKEIYYLTSGKVNVAMGSVLKLWHDYRKDGFGTELPPRELLEEAARHTSIENIIIDKENLTVEILDPKTRIDVGAVAKGYAVERIAKMLEEEGKSGYVLDVGRNLRFIGEKPNGKGWSAGIQDPLNPYMQTSVYNFEIKNEALATSGSYERFYTVGGVNYHHIINPDTLKPENHYLSVSIKSSSSALSDALSTAIFNMSYETAEKFVDTLDGVFVVLVMPDGTVETLGEN